MSTVGNQSAMSVPAPVALRPTSLHRLAPQHWAQVFGLMTDIDDTLTAHGAIEPVALAALHRLRAAGVPVVCITGRPHGWCLPFASGPQAWPVAALVAENGACALLPQADGSARTVFVQSQAERERNAEHLAAVMARIEREVPGARRAQDSAGRLCDIAIDHSEFTHLPPKAIAAVVALMQSEGLTATVSSIHINGWIGTHNKWTGAQWMARELYGQALAARDERWVYVGDSTNDQLLFEHLPHSVGVANVMRFASELKHWPTWITAGERGAGFAQVAQTLLATRGSFAGQARPR